MQVVFARNNNFFNLDHFKFLYDKKSTIRFATIRKKIENIYGLKKKSNAYNSIYFFFSSE